MTASSSSSNSLIARFGEFELDEANARLLRGGSALALSPTPFKLLCALARRPGALLTKHVLLDEVWGHRFVSDSVLKGAISDVRTVLGDDAQQPRFIETVPRRGYRFIAASGGAPNTPPESSLSAAASVSVEVSADERRQVSFVGRAREYAIAEARLGTRVEGQPRGVLDRGRTWNWQVDADRPLCGRTGRNHLCTRSLRTALRKR